MQVKAKVNYKEVLKGDRGFHFTPHVKNGILSWSNDGGMRNPTPVNIKGEKGDIGERGYYYSPIISEDGILSWENNGGLVNPRDFNIKDLMIDEVKNARVGTTGEHFYNLSDRLNTEINRLKSGEKTVLIFSDFKNYHEIPSTVEGMSKNMVIRGESVNNTRIKSLGDENNKFSILSHNDNFMYNLKKKTLNLSTGLEENSDIYFSSDFAPNIHKTYYKNLLDNEYVVTNVCYYDENKKYISQINISGLPTFECPAKTKFIRFVGRRGDTKTNVILSNIKIVIGTKFYSNYFEGKQDKKDILLPFKGGLKGFNNIYDEITNVITQRIGVRQYEQGDEIKEDVLTDKVNTLYVLDTPLIHEIKDINLKSFESKTHVEINETTLGSTSFYIFVKENELLSYLYNKEVESTNKLNIFYNYLIEVINNDK